MHHGALAYLLGINALRASEAAAVRIEDYRETPRGHRVLHLMGKRSKPATMPLTVPVLRVLKACRGERAEGPLVLRPISGKLIDRRSAAAHSAFRPAAGLWWTMPPGRTDDLVGNPWRHGWPRAASRGVRCSRAPRAAAAAHPLRSFKHKAPVSNAGALWGVHRTRGRPRG